MTSNSLRDTPSFFKPALKLSKIDNSKALRILESSASVIAYEFSIIGSTAFYDRPAKANDFQSVKSAIALLSEITPYLILLKSPYSISIP